MSVQSYSGEFTVSPIPLEFSMNYCSHKCAYCFANLNQPGRELDVKQSINDIKNCNSSKSLKGYLLKNGYPVLISNRVDPFAATNWRQTLTFIELFYKNGNDIAIQTKGGQGVDEALELLKPSCFYISLSMLDDNIRKLIETGAPPIMERIKLAQKLISKGHKVSIALNPLVEDWLPLDDYEQIIEILIEIGIKDIWIESLHLNSKQISRMTGKEKINMGSEILESAKKRQRNNSYFMYIHSDLVERGINVFSMNQPFRSDYFDGYKKTYKDKTLKTTQEFINYCFDNYADGQMIRFTDYYEFMKNDYFEHDFSEVDGFAYRIARNVYRDTVKQPFKKLKDVLFWYWNNLGVTKGLHQNKLFQVLCYEEKNKILPYLCKDTDGLLLIFNKEPKEDMFNIQN